MSNDSPTRPDSPTVSPPEGPQGAPSPKPEGRNKALDTTTLSAGIVVVLVLFVMLNYLGGRHYKRFDWTAAQIYTLSDKSVRVIESLDRDVDILVLLNPASELYAAADELLDRIVAANPERIRRQDLDAAKDLLAVQRLIDQHEIQRDNVIVVASGDDKRVIAEYELAEFDYSGSQYGQPPVLKELKGEELIVGALLSLQEEEKPRLLFTTGHGEASIEPGDARSLSQAREILGGDNFDIEEWSPSGTTAVPEGTDLVVIAGPATNFLPPELAMLDDYLARGGRLMVFADPVFQPGGTRLVNTGLDDWLAGYGVGLQEDLVLDPTSELPFYGPETLYTDSYGDHVIVDTLNQTGSRVLMPLVRSVRALKDAAGAQVTELVSTTEQGWGETGLDDLKNLDLDDNDLPGPVPVAVAVALDTAQLGGPDDALEAEAGQSGSQESADSDPAASEARLVVFGDLDWATDAHVANGANGLLLLNTFNWLVQREQLITIEGKQPKQTRLSLLDAELFMLYGLFVLVLPALAAAMGLWIAMQRRR